jgi:lipopolysaccharide/colanic/teichoic acid biosynthesis glycosyltransferase
MFKNAHQMRALVMGLNEMDGPVFKIKNDPRITKVGKFIRKYSIDELPQFWNVLKGDVSLVGPRPLPCEEVDQFTAYQKQRHLVKPGITCSWQISGRSNISFEQWIEMDLQYIRDQSVSTDLKILFKTVPAVLFGSGAY